MRLTPPTTGTFTLAVLALAAGVGARLGYVNVLGDLAFWLVTGAGLLLVAGVVFRRL